MSVNQGDKPEVVSSFKIDPELLKEPKDLARTLRVSYSSKVEEQLNGGLKGK
jgi:hypothetical protein